MLVVLPAGQVGTAHSSPWHCPLPLDISAPPKLRLPGGNISLVPPPLAIEPPWPELPVTLAPAGVFEPHDRANTLARRHDITGSDRFMATSAVPVHRSRQ